MDHPRPPNWESIVSEQSERVLRIARRILGSLHDAEDVAQEAFVEAYRISRNQRVQSWQGLLVRLATLRAIDRLRRLRPNEELRVDHPAAEVESFEHAAAAELAEWLRAAIARLPIRQSAVFTLAYFEHLSRDEIAASLGVSPGAVSALLYKARQRLASALAIFERGNLP